MGSSVILPAPGQPIKGPDPGFKAGSKPNVTTFSFKDVSPPSPIYIQRDDNLGLSVITNLTGEVVDFMARLLLPFPPQPGQPVVSGGEVTEVEPTGTGWIVSVQFTINQTGALRTSLPGTIQLTEGYLLSISALARNSFQPGQTFVRATLNRGAPPTRPSVVAYTLFEGYTTIGQSIGWPGSVQQVPPLGPGFLHTVQQANPAAGADWTFTVPTNARMRIGSIRAVYTASAALANRQVQLVVDDGGSAYWNCSLGANITASQVIQLVATGTNSPTGVVTTIQSLVIPPGLVLPAGHRIRTVTTGIDVGDQWSVIFFGVEEWIDGT